MGLHCSATMGPSCASCTAGIRFKAQNGNFIAVHSKGRGAQYTRHCISMTALLLKPFVARAACDLLRPGLKKKRCLKNGQKGDLAKGSPALPLRGPRSCYQGNAKCCQKLPQQCLADQKLDEYILLLQSPVCSSQESAQSDNLQLYTALLLLKQLCNISSCDLL